MDPFFQHSPGPAWGGAHFHEFMAEVHERIYGYRQNTRAARLPMPM